MIVAQLEPLVCAVTEDLFRNEPNEMRQFEDSLTDGRLVDPNGGKPLKLRDAILFSRKMGRPLSADELKRFEL